MTIRPDDRAGRDFEPDPGAHEEGEPSTALAEIRPLVHPGTGEVLPATPENAAKLLRSLRELRQRALDAAKDCERVIAEESSRQGKKTLRLGDVAVELYGGSEVVWDVEKLRASLRRLGCPEERILELVRETIEYKIDNTVARQLAAANPKYAKAIEAAKTRHSKPLSVRIKEGK